MTLPRQLVLITYCCCAMAGADRLEAWVAGLCFVLESCVVWMSYWASLTDDAAQKKSLSQLSALPALFAVGAPFTNVLYDDGFLPIAAAFSTFADETQKDGCTQAASNLLHAIVVVPFVSAQTFLGFSADSELYAELASEGEGLAHDTSDEAIERQQEQKEQQRQEQLEQLEQLEQQGELWEEESVQYISGSTAVDLLPQGADVTKAAWVGRTVILPVVDLRATAEAASRSRASQAGRPPPVLAHPHPVLAQPLVSGTVVEARRPTADSCVGTSPPESVLAESDFSRSPDRGSQTDPGACTSTSSAAAGSRPRGRAWFVRGPTSSSAANLVLWWIGGDLRSQARSRGPAATRPRVSPRSSARVAPRPVPTPPPSAPDSRVPLGPRSAACQRAGLSPPKVLNWIGFQEQIWEDGVQSGERATRPTPPETHPMGSGSAGHLREGPARDDLVMSVIDNDDDIPEESSLFVTPQPRLLTGRIHAQVAQLDLGPDMQRAMPLDGHCHHRTASAAE